MGGDNQTTQTTNSTPWSAAQPYLKQIMGSAQQLFNNKSGTGYYGGDTVADLNGTQMGALSRITATANQGNPLLNPAMGATTGIVNSGGLTNGMRGNLGILGGVANGSNKITTGGQYQGLLNQAGGPTSSEQNLQAYARGDYIGNGSDAFQGAMDFSSQKAEEALKRSLSGAGRYGGNAATAQAYANEIGGLRMGMLAQEQARQQGLQLQAAGQIDSTRNASLGTQAGILNGLTGVQGQNIANQMSAANSGLAGEQQGIANTLNATSMLPMLNDARYYDATKALGAGTALQEQQQQEINANIDKWNATNSQGWGLLNNYLSAMTGASSGFGTSQTSKPGGSTLGGILGGALGGATAGSAILPGWGTGVGAVLGGIGGAFK